MIIGLNVTASTAPLHVFVKFTDEKGKTINLETTSGANPARDSWIRKHFPISNKALKNGLYLQKLSKKETVAIMVEQLMQHYADGDLVVEQVPGPADTVGGGHPHQARPGRVEPVEVGRREAGGDPRRGVYHCSSSTPALRPEPMPMQTTESPGDRSSATEASVIGTAAGPMLP